MYTNKKQYEEMVQFMSKHPDFAKGHLNVPDAKNKSNNMWQKLCTDLNTFGPPERDVKGWKKVWADYKNHVKSKCRRNRNSISGTGGGPSRYCSLTALEQQTSDLLSIEEAVSGMSATLEFGARSLFNTMPSSTKDSTYENNIEDENDINLDSDFCIQEEIPKKSTPHRLAKKVFNKDTLLERQVENQISYQENSTRLLKEINENLCGVHKYLRRSSDIQDRRYKLDQKKFDLKKEKFELSKQKFLLKKEKFEYKKRNELEKSKRKVQQLEIKKSFLDIEIEKRNM